MGGLRRGWARAQTTPVWRAWQRYSTNRGNLLAGGVAFNAFFSIFPVVAIAFTVFGFLLQGHPEWLNAIRDAVNAQLPGFVEDPETGTGVIPVTMPRTSTLAGVASVGTLAMLYTGLGWLTALRNGIREIFGVEGSPGNFALAKVRDLGVLLVLGLGIALSAALSAVAGGLAERVAGTVGLGDQGWVVSAAGSLVGLLLDVGLVAVLLRLLSGVDLPWAAVRNGALFGGVGLTALKGFGTTLLAGTVGNPLFASFALVVGLLVWLNLMSRVVLVAAAWAANDLDVRAPRDHGARWRPLADPPAPAGAPRPRPAGALPASWGEPVAGPRPRTAATLALTAGSVLGVVGVLAAQRVGRGFAASRRS